MGYSSTGEYPIEARSIWVQFPVPQPNVIKMIYKKLCITDVNDCPYKDCEKPIAKCRIKQFENGKVTVWYCQHCGRPVKRMRITGVPDMPLIWTLFTDC